MYISVFSNRTPESDKLRNEIYRLAIELGFKVKERELTESQFIEAQIYDSLVVFDATIEKGQNGKLIHNYSILDTDPIFHQPLMYPKEHVLVVSRTYLPLNFYPNSGYGMRESGVPLYPKTQTNAVILQWLRKRIEVLRPTLRCSENFWAILKDRTSKTLKTSNLQREQQRLSGQVFISYRSKHYNDYKGDKQKGVKALKQRIEAGYINGVKTSVRDISPGSLAYENELLTQKDRWRVLSMLSTWILVSDELWIYDTDDYWASWWTCGELTALLYWKFYKQYGGLLGTEILGQSREYPMLKIYDPCKDTVRDAPDDYLPSITREQHRRLQRWFANTDPMTASFETKYAIDHANNIDSSSKDKIPLASDPVWSDEFQKNLVLECPLCRKVNSQKHLDLDSVIFTRMKGVSIVPFDPGDVLNCPTCNQAYQVLEEKPPRYIYPFDRRYKSLVSEDMITVPTRTFSLKDSFKIKEKLANILDKIAIKFGECLSQTPSFLDRVETYFSEMKNKNNIFLDKGYKLLSSILTKRPLVEASPLRKIRKGTALLAIDFSLFIAVIAIFDISSNAYWWEPLYSLISVIAIPIYSLFLITLGLFLLAKEWVESPKNKDAISNLFEKLSEISTQMIAILHHL